MADSILYNQEVTAEILNDIAIDLGNTSFNGFGEEKFGADALNDITKSLVTKGILMSDSRCQPIASDGYINIQPGTIVFENGAKKKITEVISVPCDSGTYIYAQNDVTGGRCEIKVSASAPATGDFVMLAEISADGTILDVREFSNAKVEVPTAIPTKITYHVSGTASGYYEDWTLLGEIECPNCDFWITTDGDNILRINVFGENTVIIGRSVRLKIEKNGDMAHVYGRNSTYPHSGQYVECDIILA